MSRQWLMPGVGFIHSDGTDQYLIPGVGFINNNESALPADLNVFASECNVQNNLNIYASEVVGSDGNLA